MIMRMPLAHFVLDATPGAMTLTVNGEVVDAASVQLLARPDEVPQLVVVQRGDATVEGDGIVHVQPEAAGNAKAYLLEWLGALDGAELERQALDAQGWGSGGLGAEILDVLKKLAGSIEE